MRLPAMLSSNPRRNPFGYALLALAVAYVGLLAAPGLLFAETSHFGALTVYSHSAVPALAGDIAQAQTLLAHSPLNDASIPQRIVLTRYPSEYAAFAPSSPHAFGVTYLFLANSFLAPSDPAANLIHADRTSFNQRPLSSVLAHERMHVLLEHHFGTLRIAHSPTWKQEGYCDFISGGQSIPDDATGLALLGSPDAATRNQPAVAYFRDALRVRFLLEQRHFTVDQLFDQTFDTPELDRDAMVAYSSR